MISISDAQRKPLPLGELGGTVHHGLPRACFSLGGGAGRYLAFLGRTSPEKGLDQAIEIAKRARMPLKIAAKIDRVDVEYFENVIKPLLAPLSLSSSARLGIHRRMHFSATPLLFSFRSIGVSPLAW